MSKLRYLQIRKAYTLTATAEDWDLYTKKAFVNEAAIALNRAFDKAVNAPDATRESITKSMHAKMREFAGLGALDSEPLRFLEHLLDIVAPDN